MKGTTNSSSNAHRKAPMHDVDKSFDGRVRLRLWFLVVVNSLVLIIFATNFLQIQSKRDWWTPSRRSQR